MKFSLDIVKDYDHKWLVDLHNDPMVLHNITNPKPISLEEHMSWWNNLNFNKDKRFIFKIDDVNAGFVKVYSIDYFNKNCILGADLHKDFRGKNLSKHMWKLLLDYVFYELKDIYRASLTTADYNEPAKKLYKNLGFIEEGRFIESLFRNDKFYDQICMYILKENYINEK
jgi:RimJ/RimL family protein N-acetyltransferase